MRAFVPQPLPPAPEVDFKEGLRRPLPLPRHSGRRGYGAAAGRYRFRVRLVRKEAVLKGHSVVAVRPELHEAGGTPAVPTADVMETSFRAPSDQVGKKSELLESFLTSGTPATGKHGCGSSSGGCALRFFLEGVRVAGEAVATARSVSETIRQDRSRIGRQGRRAGSALRVHQSLVERPVGGIRHIARRTGLSAPTVAAALGLLKDLGIAREITGRPRGKVFSYERYVAVLREGTEEPPG